MPQIFNGNISLSCRIRPDEKKNNCKMDDQNARNGTSTDNYTELGSVNIVSEPENQYDFLAREENFPRLNMA